LDFPREGNAWSYQYCRRQWSLVDNPALKYSWLADFDRALLAMAREHRLLSAPPAQLLYLDIDRKILCAERANLVFVLNFSVCNSVTDYPLHVAGCETRTLVLDSDAGDFGGHGRVDPASAYPVAADRLMKLYSPSRTGLVFAKT
jgi:1,4-alpha-glucan branching enzyme